MEPIQTTKKKPASKPSKLKVPADVPLDVQEEFEFGFYIPRIMNGFLIVQKKPTATIMVLRNPLHLVPSNKWKSNKNCLPKFTGIKTNFY